MPLPPGAFDAGPFVLDAATPRTGGTPAVIVPRCSLQGAPLPPAPPSAARVWRQTPLPRGTVLASPPGTREWPGIVNLESRFWAGALPETRVTVALDGYVVEVTARPVGYGFVLDDGTTRLVTAPGDGLAPVVAARFRRRGDHELRLFVVWAGVGRTTAPAFGLDFGVQDLGTVTIPEVAVHRVAEIRALLRSRAAAG